MTDNHSPNSNTFLKNLSQKKYAWMEEAITPPPPPPTTTTTQTTKQEEHHHQSRSGSSNNNSSHSAKPHSPNSKKNKSKRASPEPETSSSSSITLKKQKSPKPPPTGSSSSLSPATTTTTTLNQTIHSMDTTATETDRSKTVEEKKASNEPRKPQPLFKYTTFPVKGYNILPTRNITSTYGRNDKSYFPGNKAGAEEIAPDVSKES